MTILHEPNKRYVFPKLVIHTIYSSKKYRLQIYVGFYNKMPEFDSDWIKIKGKYEV